MHRRRFLQSLCLLAASVAMDGVVSPAMAPASPASPVPTTPPTHAYHRDAFTVIMGPDLRVGDVFTIPGVLAVNPQTRALTDVTPLHFRVTEVGAHITIDLLYGRRPTLGMCQVVS